MNLHVLGCSGSIAAGNRTTAFLIDQNVLIDAGTGVGDLPLEELAQIDHILLSHSHLDHVLGIPLLADSVMRERLERMPYQPIRVYGLAATLDALRKHLFNGVLWPDFTRLPSHQPIIELVELDVGQVLTIGGQRIEVLPARHTVPAVGYAVETPSGWWVYTGDTGPNPDLWATLKGRKLAQLVIETAFSDEELALAKISQHLSPCRLCDEIIQLDRPTNIAITHMKPGERAAVMGQIEQLRVPHTIQALQTGQRFSF
jgi:ribonuclease BN (tRNA processing enzyme)